MEIQNEVEILWSKLVCSLKEIRTRNDRNQSIQQLGFFDLCISLLAPFQSQLVTSLYTSIPHQTPSSLIQDPPMNLSTYRNLSSMVENLRNKWLRFQKL